MRIETDGIGLDVTVAGEGPAVILLHGWPDSHEVWRHQIPALADAGYRVIAPDLRGFGASDKPEGVEAYNILSLIGDVQGVLDHLGVDRAHVVGHDFGAAAAWAMAAFLPDRVDHLVALSVGHPNAFRSIGEPASPSARRAGTCCCSSSKGSPRSGSPWATSRTCGRGPATPTSTPSSPV